MSSKVIDWGYSINVYMGSLLGC